MSQDDCRRGGRVALVRKSWIREDKRQPVMARLGAW